MDAIGVKEPSNPEIRENYVILQVCLMTLIFRPCLEAPFITLLRGPGQSSETKRFRVEV